MEFIGVYIILSIVIVYIIYIVYKQNRDSKIILIKSGTWLLLRTDYNHDIYDKKDKYIRITKDYTKFDSTLSFHWCLYEYFEPNGIIERETISHPLKKYIFAPAYIAQKLELAYDKQKQKQLKEKQKMQDNAFKAFIK